MKITMYEVNFGEAVVYEDGNEFLLVDCGAYFRDNQNARAGMVAYNKVKNILKTNKVKKLMITHFDRDHFNGVNEMRGKIFDEIYLPYYTWSNQKDIQFTGDIFEETIKVWTCSFLLKKDEKISQIKKLFCNLKNLVYDVNNIKCVKANENIPVGTNVFNVLWPTDNGNYYKFNRDYYAELLGIVNEKYGRNLEENIIRFCSLLINYYLVLRDNNERNKEGVLEGLVREINIGYSQLEEIVESNSIQLEDKDKRRINSINSTLIKSMNDCSIVMHIENKVLALGDVSSKIFNIIRKNSEFISERYEVIKIAHHGTKAYYCGNLPEAYYFLISNSGEKRTNWGIYGSYRLNYMDTELICTNTNPYRCDFICSKCYGINFNKCINCIIGMCSNVGDKVLEIDSINDSKDLFFVHGFTNLYGEYGHNADGIYRNFVTLVKYDEDFNISNVVDLPIRKMDDNINEGDFVYLVNDEVRSAESDERVINYKNISRELIRSIDYENYIIDDFSKLEIDDVVSYHINVGHGNCSIIVFGNKDTKKYDMWLIDCSTFDFRSRKSCKGNLNKCLLSIKKKYGISRFSKVLITHHHFDHINGLEYLINEKYINSETEVWLNVSYYWPGEKYIKILKELKKLNVKFIEPITSNSFDNIEILYPKIRIHNKNNAPGKYINNISVVYQIKFMNKSMLFMGDLEEEGLSEIQDCFPHLKNTNYYCVSHHGSINGHIRKNSPCNSIGDMTMNECAKDTRIQILMGRDNAYPGIFSDKVIKAYDKLIITDKCDCYYEIDWTNDKVTPF